MMRIWQELVTTALVGIAQHPLNLDPPPSPIGDALRCLIPSEPATDLLTAAGIVALWQQAAQQIPSTIQSRLEPCPSDTQPRCNEWASQHLALMLAGQHNDLLSEWLTAVAASGKRVAEPYLPELLEAGHARTGLRDRILPVLGERGRWLAQQNPDWQYAVDALDEAVWQTGTREQRLGLLRKLRQQQPDQARDLVIASWQQESAKDRSAFLALLTIQLSMADEPFLEQALDDRNKEVRRVAAELLAQLPESRLVQRLCRCSETLLSFRAGRLLGKDSLQVQPPATGDATLLRDGVDAKTAHSYKNLGERAWQFAQILGAVPPCLWCRKWDRSPAALAKSTRKHEWRQALLVGWTMAALRHHDEDWAAALLAELPDDWSTSGELLAILPGARRETYVLQWLERTPKISDRLLQALRAEQVWSMELSRAVLKIVQTRSALGKTPDWRLRSVLEYLAHSAPPELAEEAASGWPTQTSQWSMWDNVVQENLALLRFRHDMLTAIRA